MGAIPLFYFDKNFMANKTTATLNKGIKINNSELEKVENWTSGKWGVIYFSHADTRTRVPKKITKMRWTLNLAKPAGDACLTGLFI